MNILTRLLQAVSLLFSTSAIAVAPDAGQLSRDLPPAKVERTPSATDVIPSTSPSSPGAADADVRRVVVQRIRITGNKAFPETVLLDAVGDVQGKALSFAELQQLAGRVSDYYRAAGYFVARAYLPQQDMQDGELEIAVLEGRLSDVILRNATPAGDDVLLRFSNRIATDAPLRIDNLERQLLLLDDLPGVDVHSTLQPGASVGTSQLAIDAIGGDRINGYASVGNDGNQYTGRNRVTGGVDVHQPFAIGDALSLRAGYSGRGFHFGRAAWQVPVGGAGWQIGIAGSKMQYQLQEEFAALDAHGTATIGSVYGLYPIIRSRTRNLNFQLNLERKTLKDDLDAAGLQSKKTVSLVMLGMSAESSDQVLSGGLTQLASTVTFGELSLDPISGQVDELGHRTAGHYTKLYLQFSRMQQLSATTQLNARISLQRSSKNLDSSEKLGVTGAQGVRGYDQGDVSGDRVAMLKVDLRYAFSPSLQGMITADAAYARLNAHPLAADGDNNRKLSSIGLGFEYRIARNTGVTLNWASRTGEQATADSTGKHATWVYLTQVF